LQQQQQVSSLCIGDDHTSRSTVQLLLLQHIIFLYAILWVIQHALLQRWAPSPTLVTVKISSSVINNFRNQEKMQASGSIRGDSSFLPPRLKQQPSASATPLHFQQQPSPLNNGSMNFSDLNNSHCGQQQLFLLSHGCRHSSSALA